ncbi:hypothetical protein M9458_023564, partial [Cirrhinus mrigala]
SPSLLLSINSGKHPVAGQLCWPLSKLFLQPHIHCLGKQPIHKDTSPLSHLHVHLPEQRYPIFHLPQRGLPFPESLQEVLKAERLSPMGGSSFLNLSSATGGVYGPSPHMLGPYGSYMTTSQDYSSAALYSSAGPWMSPSSYSPKLRNKMRLSPP